MKTSDDMPRIDCPFCHAHSYIRISSLSAHIRGAHNLPFINVRGIVDAYWQGYNARKAETLVKK